MSEENTKKVAAFCVEQKIYESTLHFSHSMATNIHRIIVDLSNEADTGPFLVIYFWNGEMGAYMIETKGEYSKAEFRKVKDIEIPEELFYTALELNALRKKIKEQKLEEVFNCFTDR